MLSPAVKTVKEDSPKNLEIGRWVYLAKKNKKLKDC